LLPPEVLLKWLLSPATAVSSLLSLGGSHDIRTLADIKKVNQSNVSVLLYQFKCEILLTDRER
jgi:hypothetical protein